MPVWKTCMYVTPKIFGVALKESREIPGVFHQPEIRFLFDVPTTDSGENFILPFLWRNSLAAKKNELSKLDLQMDCTYK